MLEEAKKVIRRRGFGSELFAKTVKVSRKTTTDRFSVRLINSPIDYMDTSTPVEGNETTSH